MTAVEGGEQALALCERGDTFDAIISDIEMPGMNGFQLAEAVRADTRWADVPIVALSSHTTSEDLERGRRVGFTDYVAKLDRDALLETLAQTVGA